MHGSCDHRSGTNTQPQLTIKAAEQLLGTNDLHAVSELWAASCHFGAALKQDNLELYPVTADVIDSIAAIEQRNRLYPGLSPAK
jgi:hypothetical protein